MNTCKKIQSLIYPYLDGELSASDNRTVEEHVLGCHLCNEILQEQRRFLALLNNPALLEKGPAELKNRILHTLNPRPRLFPRLADISIWYKTAGLAVAASLLFVLITAIWQQHPLQQAYLQDVAVSHASALRGKLPLELVHDDPEVVARWLKDQAGIDAVFPVFVDENVRLMGGRVYTYKGQNVGLVSYMVHGVPVTLAITQNSPATAIETSDYSFIGDRRINFTTAKGFNVVSWSVCANNFALVSTLPHKGKPGCTVCHGNGSGLIDLSEFYTKT